MSALDELKEGYNWIKIPPNTFQFDIPIPGSEKHWLIIVDAGTWRVQCDEGEKNFTDENMACSYFWERLMVPPKF